jgi:hypothetical protein
VYDIKGEGLETPFLLQCHGVMGAAKPDTGASKRPMNIGMVSDVQGRVCCYGMGGAG